MKIYSNVFKGANQQFNNSQWKPAGSTSQASLLFQYVTCLTHIKTCQFNSCINLHITNELPINAVFWFPMERSLAQSVEVLALSDQQSGMG